MKHGVGILRTALAVLAALVATGCVAETERTVGKTEWIVDGERATEPQVVVVYNRRGGLCTGSIIAPRVVLTAKHCVQASGADAPDDPRYFTVGIGNSIRGLSQNLQVIDIKTTPGVYTSGSRGLQGALVGIDVAVMVLQRGVTDFEPLEIRREDPSELTGKEVVAIGFGQTPSGETGTKYRTTTTMRGVSGGVVYTNPSTCQGDSGGPIIDPETNQVFAVTSFGNGSCGAGGIAGANRIDMFLEMIDAAVGESGSCVNDGEERCDGFDNDCDDEVDEGCIELGEPCETSDECIGNNCADTPEGRRCTVECDPLRPQLSCPVGLYCVKSEGCSGVCVPGGAGPKGNDEDCEANTECASLYCADPGDGRKRCLQPCRGGDGLCLAGEVCAAVIGACGGCVPADIVEGGRGLGEPCGADGECTTGTCIDEAGMRYCTRACGVDDDCASGFHCRDEVCIRGDRGGVGSGCLENGDCEEGAICAARGDVRWCTEFCDLGDADVCPEGFACVDVGAAKGVCAPEGGLVGESCTNAAECISGLCASVGGESVCTRNCGPDAPCSPGFECRRTADGTDAVCVEPVPFDPGDGGCSCSLARPDEGPGGHWALLGLAVGLILIRRRRK